MVISRRAVVAGAALAGMAASPAPETAWGFEFRSIDEGELRFDTYRGQVMLVVNTASFCSFTPQYKQLEALHKRLKPRGFTVVGVPTQDFGQESATNGEVKAFCELTYEVDFPMTAIDHVRGPQAAPFYRWVRAQRRWEPTWNFAKVLIDRNGTIAGTFSPTEEVDRGRLASAIEAAIGRG